MQWDHYKFVLKQLDYSPSFSTSDSQRVSNYCIVLVEFLLKFTSNDSSQLFLDAVFIFAPEKECLDWTVQAQ